MKLNLSGFADTQKVLQLVQEGMAKQGVRKAVRAGAEVIKDAIVERTPILDEKTAGSNSLDPGSLREDIAVHMKTEGGEPVAIIGPSDNTARVARWVEYGHVQVTGGYSKAEGFGRRRGPGKVIGHVPAHPFIRSGFEASKDEAIKAFAVESGKQLKEVVK